MPERTLTVRIIGDDRSLQQAFARSEKAGKGFQVGVSGIGAAAARSILPAAAAALSVQKAFQIAGDSIAEASAVNEEIAKSEQVFGDSSAAIVDWAETTARAIGVSKRSALEATGTFGNLFSTVGIGPKAAASMSRALVELAADMASFNNASPVEVLEAIRSGLIGEAEPLRRYGVLLSEARVQQVAMAETGKRNASALTQQEKAHARYTIILRDTIKAQGDVERTSGSLANQQRQLAAQVADLEAALGALLIPQLTELVTTLNDVVAAGSDVLEVLEKIADFGPIEVPVSLTVKILFAGRGPGGARSFLENLKGDIGDALDSAFTAGLEPFKALLDRLEGGAGRGWTFFPSTADDPGRLAEDAADRANKAADRTAKAALEADRAKRRSAKAFAELVKGLGLKLDKAGLTATLADDLAALRELERAIQKRIKSEGRTFELVQQLTDVRLRISALTATQAADAQQKISDAFNDALDALALELDIARTTRQFGDDLRALREIEAAILRRIRAEGRTTELLRRLFENRQEQARTLTAQRNAAQFEALGLTPEGDRPIASRQALLRRAKSLQDQVKGTILDTPKTRRDLARIVNVLRQTTKGVGRDVRRAILDMLNDISSALEGGSSAQKGPMTKFAKRGIEGLVRGLGLTAEQVKEIRQRFSQFSRFDVGSPAGRTTQPRGSGVRPVGESGRDVTVNVYIDGQKVEATVTRRQQKKRGRNAPSRRGVRPGV